MMMMMVVVVVVVNVQYCFTLAVFRPFRLHCLPFCFWGEEGVAQ
jgi:hypothetical protein